MLVGRVVPPPRSTAACRRSTKVPRGSGSALWRQDGLLRRQPSGIALAGSLAVVGDLEGYLHWFDPNTGAFKARERVGNARILATPLVTASGTVVADRKSVV